jgi:hypothetical protein
MRFGQLMAFACSMAGEGAPGTLQSITDETVLEAINKHLASRFGAGSNLRRINGLSTLNETRGQLVDVLRDLGQKYPQLTCGRIIVGLAALAHVNAYDAEDRQLVEAVGTVTPGVQWFDWYSDKLETQSTQCSIKVDPAYRCPCCRHQTLYERGGFEICPVCYWEDDGQDDRDADAIRWGPNGPVSLTQARGNYAADGVFDAKFRENVRPPRPEEA